MALFHLDPRQAGTGAAPDIWVTHGPAHASNHYNAIHKATRQVIANGDNEPAALRAAREAAGFGHVAERACDATQTHVLYHCNIDTTCRVCAWPRDAHKVQS